MEGCSQNNTCQRYCVSWIAENNSQVKKLHITISFATIAFLKKGNYQDKLKQRRLKSDEASMG